jgi:hypothetical protein
MTITPCYAANGGKPKFLEFISPIGKAVHSYHDKPQLQTKENSQDPVLDKDGIQVADFKVTLWWPKAERDTTLVPMRTLAAQVRDEAWGPDAGNDAWLNLQPFLMDGDNPEHNTKKREYLFGGVYMNFKQSAKPTRHPNGQITYAGAPGLIDAYNNDAMPTDMYAGAMCRVSGIMFGTEYSGKRFISKRLNNIQIAPGGPWERIGGGGRPDAKSQFDPLATGVAGGAPLGNIL